MTRSLDQVIECTVFHIIERGMQNKTTYYPD